MDRTTTEFAENHQMVTFIRKTNKQKGQDIFFSSLSEVWGHCEDPQSPNSSSMLVHFGWLARNQGSRGRNTWKNVL